MMKIKLSINIFGVLKNVFLLFEGFEPDGIGLDGLMFLAFD